jgi:hypothetical protein
MIQGTQEQEGEPETMVNWIAIVDTGDNPIKPKLAGTCTTKAEQFHKP